MEGVTLSFNVLFLRLCLLLVEIQFLLRISSCIHPGFSADIIHRDSPESPLYDPFSTPYSRLHAAVNRSAFRMNYLRRARIPDFKAPPLGPIQDGLSNPLYNYNFEFLMSFHIGSNGMKAFVGIDTGSPYTWLLCEPCEDCYKHVPPIFHPIPSETYNKLNCSIQPCTFHSNSSCDSEGKCEYVINYLDDSMAKGILSIETLGFNSVDEKKIFKLHHIILGCTHETKGKFAKGGIGLVGLNRGVLSLISQIGPTFGRRFSYCLPHMNGYRSQFFFGTAAIVSGHGVMSTPLLSGFEDDYGLLLNSIMIGKEEPIIVRPPQNKLYGNIMIDSGTMLTYVEPMLDIIEKVKKHIPLKTKSVRHYDLCFDTRGLTKGYHGKESDALMMALFLPSPLLFSPPPPSTFSRRALCAKFHHFFISASPIASSLTTRCLPASAIPWRRPLRRRGERDFTADAVDGDMDSGGGDEYDMDADEEEVDNKKDYDVEYDRLLGVPVPLEDAGSPDDIEMVQSNTFVSTEGWESETVVDYRINEDEFHKISLLHCDFFIRKPPDPDNNVYDFREMYVTPPDTDVYSIPRVLAPMPQKYIRCAKKDFGCYNVTEPPIDAPRDPLYKTEREIFKVFLTKHYRNRRIDDSEFILDFEEIYVIDSKSKSISRAKVIVTLPEGKGRDRRNDLLIIRDGGTSFKIIDKSKRDDATTVIQREEWIESRREMEKHLSKLRDFHVSNWF